jgi:HlyD family secretion protein
MSAQPDSATLAFQSELDRIVGAPAPLHLRLVSAALAALLVSAVALAAVTRVDMDVTGHGRLASENPMTMLQPLDRAILRTLAVRAGDVVQKGQMLATLDGTFAQADVGALTARLAFMAAEAARLRAELAGGSYGEKRTPDEQMQAALSQLRLREYAAKLAGFDQAIAHDAAELATDRDQAASLRHQVALARQVKSMRDTLMQGAEGSRLQYLDADSALTRETGDLAAATDRIAELGHATLSHQADRRAFIETWRRDIVEALANNRNETAQLQSSLDKAAHVQQLVQVTAPEDGVIIEVAARGPGSVLKEAEPLLTLLPAHAGLRADISIKSADIGYIRAGDPVTVKVDAYPYQRHGTLHGHVRAIAAASFDTQTAPGDAPGESGAMHRVTVDLSGDQLTGLPPGTGPMPGMTISGDVRVGQRSVLGYFLQPLTRGFAQSLREP